MISTTSNKIVKSIFNNKPTKNFPPDILREVHKRLLMLHNASSINDLKIPKGNRLEKLIGTRLGQYSIRINDKWRICFRFENGNAYDVEIVDYH